MKIRDLSKKDSSNEDLEITSVGPSVNRYKIEDGKYYDSNTIVKSESGEILSGSIYQYKDGIIDSENKEDYKTEHNDDEYGEEVKKVITSGMGVQDISELNTWDNTDGNLLYKLGAGGLGVTNVLDVLGTGAQATKDINNISESITGKKLFKTQEKENLNVANAKIEILFLQMQK